MICLGASPKTLADGPRLACPTGATKLASTTRAPSRSFGISGLVVVALVAGACRHAPDVGDADARSTGGLDAGTMDAAPIDPSAYDPDPRSPNEAGFWRGATFYQVFVRSFADSNGDGIGDFDGLTAKLDYLNDGDPNTTTDLGVEGIWLMPIHPSPSYHGYDVLDDRAVHPDFGGMPAFERFLAAAKQRGIPVIIDFVLNHASSQHVSFRSAARGDDPATRAMFSFRGDDPGWKRPWDGAGLWHSLGANYYYGIFWSGMPDWNLANPTVAAERTAAMRFWLEKGVAGFRVDAVRYLVERDDGTVADTPETHALSKRIRDELHTTHPGALLVAEAWTSNDLVAGYYGRGNEYQLAFDFDLSSAIKSSVRDGNRATLAQTLRAGQAAFAADPAFAAPFLSNHDMRRVISELASDAAGMRLAAGILFAMTGTPFVYYGEELGMAGGPQPRDEDKRTPMRWTAQGPQHGFTTAARSWYGDASGQEVPGVDVATQSADPASLLSLYRRLIALRRVDPALRHGRAELIDAAQGGRGSFAWLRTHEGRRTLFVANLHGAPSAAFTLPVAGTPRALLSDGLTEALTRQPDGNIRVPALPGRAFAFIALDP